MATVEATTAHIAIQFGNPQPAASMCNTQGQASIVDGVLEVSSPAISKFAYQYGWRKVAVRQDRSYVLEWNIEAIEGEYQIAFIDETSGEFFGPRTALGQRQGSLRVRSKTDSMAVIIFANLPEVTPVRLRVHRLVLREAQWNERVQSSVSSEQHAGKESPPFLFSSGEFIFLFLPLLLLIYRRIKNVQACIALLLLASLLWYAAWDWRLLPMLLTSIFISWFLAQKIAHRRQRWLVILAIGINLAPLAFFKYLVFAFEASGQNPQDWLPLPIIPTILPLGLSFYTFQQIAYIVDVYKGDAPERSFVRYAFFVSFFPQLVAGPIVHHKQLLPQIGTSPDRPALMLKGTIYFVIGLTKKLLIADTIADGIAPYYELGGIQGAIDSLAAITGYACQLYFDFSGYSDMAMGLAAMFGFVLPINFNSPYKAQSIADFWRRWHITLSAFLRDYVYIPLGGNRHGDFRKTFNLLLTMLIGGLWHGAGWAFIVWGGLHGLALATQQVFAKYLPNFKLGPLAGPFTILLVFALWVPFRAERLDVSLEIFVGLSQWGGHLDLLPATAIILALILVFFFPNSHQLTAQLERHFSTGQDYLYRLSQRIGVYALLAPGILVLGLWSFHGGVDYWLARTLDTGRSLSVYTDGGTLRGHISDSAALSGSESKWIVAGSSFSRFLHGYSLQLKDRTIRSCSIGVGGQNLANWIRPIEAALGQPHVEVIFLALSPVAVTGFLQSGSPFPEEGSGMLAKLDPTLIDSANSCTVAAIDMDFLEFARSLTTPRQSETLGVRLLQISDWLSNLAGSALSRKADLARIEAADLASAAREAEALHLAAANNPQPAKDIYNGQESKFHWRDRGIKSALQASGLTYRVLEQLAAMAKTNNIQLILYETPTPSHLEAPHIYPEAFFEEYQSAMTKLAADLNLEYWDLSGFLPWDRIAMIDFIHPNDAGRALVHRELLRRQLQKKETK